MFGIIDVLLDLFTQLPDEYPQVLQLIDMIGTPYFAQEVLVGENFPRVFYKKGQERVLGSCQFEKLVVLFNGPAGQVNGQSVEPDHGTTVFRRGAPQG